jgi:hypothetical protein
MINAFQSSYNLKYVRTDYAFAYGLLNMNSSVFSTVYIYNFDTQLIKRSLGKGGRGDRGNISLPLTVDEDCHLQEADL